MEQLTDNQRSARSMRMRARRLLKRAIELDGNQPFIVVCKHSSGVLADLLWNEEKMTAEDIAILAGWDGPGCENDQIYSMRIDLISLVFDNSIILGERRLIGQRYIEPELELRCVCLI